VIVTEPDVDGGVYATEHVLEDELFEVKVHGEPVKLPPLPPSFQDTVPAGDAGVALVSVTVAVNAIVLPMVTDEWLGVTTVVVGRKEPPEEEANRSLMMEAVASFCPKLPNPKMFSTVANNE